MSNERTLQYQAATKNDLGEWEIQQINESLQALTYQEIIKLSLEKRKLAMTGQLAYQDAYVQEFLDVNALEGLSSDTITLSKMVLDFEERVFYIQYLEKGHERAKLLYEKDKKELKGKRYHTRVGEWQSENQEFTRSIESAKKVQDEAFDIFIEEFFPNLEQLKLSIEEIKDLSPNQLKRVNNFLSHVAQSIENNDNKERVKRLNYLENPDDEPNTVNLYLLQKIISEAVSDKHPEDGPKTHIQQISLGLIKLYSKNTNNLYSREQEIHLVRFVHDMLFAACLTRDPAVVIEVTKILESNICKKQEYVSQHAYIFNKYLKEILPFINQDDAFRSALKYFELAKFFEKGEYGDEVKQELEDLEVKSRPSIYQVIGESFILMQGLYLDLGYAGNVLIKSKNIREFERKIKSSSHPILFKAFMSSMRNFMHTHDNLWANASLFLTPRKYESVFEETTANTMELLGEVDENIKMSHEASVIQGEILISLFMDKTEKSVVEIIEKNKELKRQHERIRDEYQYFIALNGDMYTNQKDTELNELGIDKLTFYPLRGSRNIYKTTMKLNLPYANRSETLTLFIGKDGRIYNNIGELLNLPVFILNNLQILLFNRLEYITSGAAFAGQEGNLLKPIMEPESPTREILARRSHWRTLSGNRYTLQSTVAQKHIQEVFEDYGINTWEEILARRSKGTLGKNKVLTYVKAVMKYGAEPNIIIFEPKSVGG
jgi:hypothetical protein